jgi:hypothetical protein
MLVRREMCESLTVALWRSLCVAFPSVQPASHACRNSADPSTSCTAAAPHRGSSAPSTPIPKQPQRRHPIHTPSQHGPPQAPEPGSHAPASQAALRLEPANRGGVQIAHLVVVAAAQPAAAAQAAAARLRSHSTHTPQGAR